MKNSRKILLLLCLLVLMTLTGCKSNAVKLVVGGDSNVNQEETKTATEKLEKKSDDTFDEAMEKFGADGTQKDIGSDTPIDEQIVSFFLKLYHALKEASPYIAVVSFVIGFLIFLFARGNKKIRKFGLFGLMIGMPLVMIVINYGIGYTKDMFMK